MSLSKLPRVPTSHGGDVDSRKASGGFWSGKIKKRSSDGRPSKWLMIYSLRPHVTEERMRTLCEKFGRTSFVRRVQQVCFVGFERFADAKTAKYNLNGNFKSLAPEYKALVDITLRRDVDDLEIPAAKLKVDFVKEADAKAEWKSPQKRTKKSQSGSTAPAKATGPVWIESDDDDI